MVCGNRTHVPLQWKHRVLTTGPPGKSPSEPALSMYKPSEPRHCVSLGARVPLGELRGNRSYAMPHPAPDSAQLFRLQRPYPVGQMTFH